MISSAKIEIEQRIHAASKAPARRANRLVQRLDRRQDQAGPTGADQHRRHHHVQAIEHTRLQEARNRHATALHQHAPVSGLSQPAQHCCGLEAAGSAGHGTTPHVARAARRITVLRHHMQRRRRAVVEHARLGHRPPPWIEHHAQRVGAGHVAHGQLRIVRVHRTHAHHHRIDHGAQAMQVRARLDGVDVMRRTALGGDAAVQTLPELGNHPRPRLRHQRKEEIEQFGRLRGQRGRTAPGATRIDFDRNLVDDETCGAARGPISVTGLQDAGPAPIW